MNKAAHGITVENLLASLPQVLQEDENMHALAATVAEALAARPDEIDRLRIYARIDELPEDMLDLLAYDFKVDWWNGNYTLEEKRATLKDSWRVHRTLGTTAAVNEAISAISPETKVREWYEYDGQPGCFRLYSTDPAITGPKLADLFRLLNIVKRASAKLDAVWVELESTGHVTYGVVSEMSGRMDIWPLVVREMEATAEAATASVLTYQGTLEIFPQGGVRNG